LSEAVFINVFYEKQMFREILSKIVIMLTQSLC